jgi:hypothetical protein
MRAELQGGYGTVVELAGNEPATGIKRSRNAALKSPMVMCCYVG